MSNTHFDHMNRMNKGNIINRGSHFDRDDDNDDDDDLHRNMDHRYCSY
jgi:hypothetical protein